jgi:AcrR family transcriptional regulator
MAKTADRRQELRQKLIDAAEKAISEKGLAGLKARDLAEAVGCALGAIYNVFPDLDALIYEVNARTLAAFGRVFERLEQSEPVAAASETEAAIARLVRLATGYLDFAARNQPRWRALFEHRMAEKRDIPDWYVERQRPLFLLVEEPLGALRPDLAAPERERFARTMFSAVHGVVILGLDEKLMPLPMPALREQVKQIVAALGIGLVRSALQGQPGLTADTRRR